MQSSKKSWGQFSQQEVGCNAGIIWPDRDGEGMNRGIQSSLIKVVANCPKGIQRELPLEIFGKVPLEKSLIWLVRLLYK